MLLFFSSNNWSLIPINGPNINQENDTLSKTLKIYLYNFYRRQDETDTAHDGINRYIPTRLLKKLLKVAVVFLLALLLGHICSSVLKGKLFVENALNNDTSCSRYCTEDLSWNSAQAFADFNPIILMFTNSFALIILL